jgi:hypothetical protein
MFLVHRFSSDTAAMPHFWINRLFHPKEAIRRAILEIFLGVPTKPAAGHVLPTQGTM